MCSYSNTNQGYKQKGFSVTITPMYQLLSLFLLGCLVLILPACGGSPKDNDAATGSISFKLQPPDDQSSTASGASPLMQAAMLDCNKYSGISVEALVYDENDVLITQGGPWDCIAGEGIIYGVTAGTDRSVRVNLRSISGAVVLTGNKLGITVIDGQMADTGYIQLVRPPVVESEAADDSATVTRGGTVTVLNSGAGSVLLNDNGEGLSVVTTPIAGPLYGSLTLRSDGTFSYTQDGSKATSDSFVYRVLDIFGKEDTATVTITINPNPNNAPVLSGPGVSPSSGLTTDTFTYSVRYTDQDGDSPGSAVVYIDGSAHTMALASGLTSNGAYTFSTTLGAGSHTYYFSFTDGKGDSARQPESGSIDGPTVTASLCNADFTVATSSNTFVDNHF